MQDLPRSPHELLPEVTALLPYFIENLGNSKVSDQSALSHLPPKNFYLVCFFV